MINYIDVLNFIFDKFKKYDKLEIPVSDTFFKSKKLYQITITIKEIK